MRLSAPLRGGWYGRGSLKTGLRRLLVWGLVALATAAAWPAAGHAQAGPSAVTDSVITNCANDAQLVAAVGVAGPSTVTFNCGPGNHTIPMTSAIAVPGTVTVNGNGRITLDGRNLVSFFQVNATGDLTLRNLTLTRGSFNGVHPLENFGRLALVNVTVSDNQSSAAAGVLYNSGTLVVRDARFLNNLGTGTGSTNTQGAAIYNEAGVAAVENSVFTGNRSTSALGAGGAIAVANGHMSIEASTFHDNEALDGGALFVDAGTVVTVTVSTFQENTAGYGGAIETRGELQLDYSTLVGNKAVSGDGGGIWVFASDLDMNYSPVSGNAATTTGGGISCYDNNISVTHSTISGNTAGTFGGGIYSTCDVNLTNSTLSGNTSHAANGGGGGLYQTGSDTATIAATTIARNSGPFGAGVYNDNGGSTLTLQYTLLANNTTGNCDGVITSLGYNLSSDTNCTGALSQTGDKNNVALPLGPLTGNGGPTATHFPLRGNPARNAIPAAQCYDDDQRGVDRPQGAQCEIGAVEAFLSLWLPLTRK